jgi:hypothetical protein
MAQGITYPSVSLEAMFNLTQVHVEFVVDKAAMGRIFLSVVHIPLSLSFLQFCILIHSCIGDPI